jgi:hypothetical protein
MDVILGCALIYVLNLISCRNLNSKVEEYFESALMVWSKDYIWHT